MRTKNILKHLILGATIIASGNLVGQATVPGNVAGGATDFLGWNTNAANNFPLEIRHDGAYPIQFWTSGAFRGQINEKTNYSIGPSANDPRNGFTLLSGRSDFMQNVKGPFSRLHLADDVGDDAPIVYAQDIGYRGWMRNGITFTGNSDQAYIGQKYKGNDNTDFVIQWSDNPDVQPWGTDRMKFIFSSAFTGDHTGMGSEYGLEAMRLWPKNEKEVNVGIGDFFAYGGDPTERLHVRDGRVRIQQLPDDDEADGEYKVMVVDATNDPHERGVVKWANISGTGGNCSSGWSLNGNNAVTAFNGNPCPPQDPDRVGIGTTSPLGKLHVEYTAPAGLNSTGLFTKLQGGNFATGNWTQVSGASSNRGIFGEASGGNNATAMIGGASGASINNMGGQLHATGGQYGVGVEAIAQGATDFSMGLKANGRNAAIAYGVNATAELATGHNYAVFATVNNLQADPWAGWFVGKVMGTYGSWVPSDTALKENIVPMSNAMDVVSALQPHLYNYRTDQFPQMSLPEEPQAGLLAQELAEVEPSLVTTATQPAELDSLGNMISPEVQFKAINYTGLIPYLIGAIQAQNERIDQLQDQIDQCCSAPTVAPESGTDQHGSGSAGKDLQEQRLLIIPNPVADLTTLEYYVPKAGKVSLQVSTSDGKPLATLREELAEAGAYSYSWNTTKLSAGTYFCTFMLDGAVVVKRAVKVK